MQASGWVRALLIGVAATAPWVGCGAPEQANTEDETLGRMQEAVITGTGLCRASVLTASATSTTITNAQDTTITPSISARYPLELTVLSGDARKFRGQLGPVSGTSYCQYAAAGPGRMVRSNCVNVTVDAPAAFSSSKLTLERLSGATSISVQATISPADDNTRCTSDACDPTTGVSHANMPAGTTCSVNNNPCDGVEVCDNAGSCLPGANAPAGTACSDGEPCNGLETCNGSGTCAAGTAPPSGTSCSDGLYCNGEEYCVAGTCQAGTVPPASHFDDHDPCTADSCSDAKGGIVNAPIAGCVAVTNAPALDPTSSASFAASTQFLYTGTTPLQTGVAAGTIDPNRVAVIRGRVLQTNGTSPMSGATVTIVGHPEYGQTLTRSDGWYDLAVNGGAPLAVDIVKTGWLRLQRAAKTPVLNYIIVDDVVLTAPYLSTDKFVPGSSVYKVVRGTTTAVGADADGSRRALLYFPPMTRATNYTVADGTNVDVQVTEYTVGNGPRRMPGTLPTTTGYTYAVEVGFPAAAALGIADVTFDKNVSLYTDNFTGYPVGTTVPLGYYNRTKAAWEAERSGRIIKIVTAPTGGQATIDTNGDGVAETTTVLDGLGIDATERTMLAAQYSAGKQLWRCAVPHFSPWDANWGAGPPPGAPAPPGDPPKPYDPDDPCEREGSIIGCESRTLGESLPVHGTPFSLNYQSSRAQGYRSAVRIRVTDGTTLPSSFIKAHIDIEAAGRAFHYERVPPLAANDSFTWVWDGIDAYGRNVQHGVVDAKVRIGFEYNSSTTFSTETFGAGGSGTTITGDRVARTVTLWKESSVRLRRSEAKTLGFGGWTLSAAHSLESLEALYFGDGHRRDLSESEQEPLNYIVDTFAGGGTNPNFGDGGPAVGAYLGGQITDLVVAPDGTMYIAQDGNSSGAMIRRVLPNGIIDTIAGLPPVVSRSASSDGSVALNAQVRPTNMVLQSDGSLVFTESFTDQIWKIDTGSPRRLRLVAGTGAGGGVDACNTNACGDNGPATSALIQSVGGIVVAADDALLFMDGGHNRVRRIGPEGKITTFYKANNYSFPDRLVMRPDGSTFIVDNTSSVLSVPFFGGTYNPPGDYSIPPMVALSSAQALRMNSDVCGQASSFFGNWVVLPDDSWIVTCYNRIVRRSPTGIFTRIAGAGDSTSGYSGDGGSALRALFGQAWPVAVNARGEIFVGDRASGRVRRLKRPTALTSSGNLRVPAKDGSEVYEFSPEGRHLRTLTSRRGAARYTFGYDPTSKLLTSITDEASNVTQIARTASAVTITAPFGQVTTINLDGNGFASSVVNPVAGEITQLAHSNTGLLTDLTDPKAHAHHFEYQADGRLTKDVDATPGSPGTRLAWTTLGDQYMVEITSPEGRVTRHEVQHNQSFGDPSTVERRRITNAVGLVTIGDKSADGAPTVTRPDGSTTTVQNIAIDSRWGVLASYPSTILRQIGTKSHTWTEARTSTLATAGDPTTVTSETITNTVSATGQPTITSSRVFAGGSPATITRTSGAGRQVRDTLDSLDRVTKREILGATPVTLSPVVFHYDTRGRVDSVTWGTRVYGTTFNATTGWVSTTTDPASLGLTYNTRDNDGRPTLITLPGSRSLAMSYDLAGNMTSVTPPSKPAHGFSFDPNDRLASYVPPNGTPSVSPKDTTYGRDLDGLLLLANNPLKPVLYSYDLLGRVLQRTDAVKTMHTYDAQGRLATISTSGAPTNTTITNSWDGSLLTQQSTSGNGPVTHALNKSYDNLFRVSSWNIDGTNPISITYDSDNLVTAAGGMTVTRSLNGLLTGTTLGSVSDTWGYNSYGEVTSHSVTGSATAFNVTTTRDAAGRIDLKTETVGGVTHSYKYGYDTAGRLASVKVDGATTPTRSWTYDQNGNRAGGTYDGQDRLTALGSTTYTYGNNGELATKTVGGVTTTYSYDARGNLRSVVKPGTSIEYVVDGQNRRVGKRLNGAYVQGFVYDGTRIVAELKSDGSESARFVYVGTDQSPDLMLKSGIYYRYVKDALGSPRLLVNSSTGQTVERLDYDEWGNVTSGPVSGEQPFGFAGGLYDRETELIRFGGRDYSPNTARWLSKDAARFRAGQNFYMYCHGDPINYVDLNGRRDIGQTVRDVIAATAAAAGAGVGAAEVAAGVALGAALTGGAVVLCTIVDCTVADDSGTDSSGGLPSTDPDPGPGDGPGGGPGSGPGSGGGSGGGLGGGGDVCDDDDEPDDCKRKATKWELKRAGIDAHDAKGGIVGKKSMSRYDICVCESGGFALKRLGCKGPIVDRL